MSRQLPLVDYLVLDDPPHLVAQECTSCGARFFGRRNACASCSGTEFTPVDVPREGRLRTYTIVAFGAPGVDVPYVAGVVDCDGTSVRGNVVGVEPSPEHLTLGMPLRLTTFVTDRDDEGTEAIGFGFEPMEAE
ncbi:MAG: hypothetical protein JWM89_2570 [Acidimicrobiales bacterium]|nr:hypothetical protein [Acidimicrobiales bacterium]